MVENPFEVTKAVDFTDAQIANTWVDLPGGGFYALADPRSPMPTFLVGGKGGGRTHLLRYFSFALQRLRNEGNLLERVHSEGYVGVYFRCGGLNSSRFSGKRQSEETWAAVFSYYTELWLGRLTLDVIEQLRTEAPDELPAADMTALDHAVRALFDVELPPGSSDGTLQPLIAVFQQLQRQLDVAVNNAALSHQLGVRIGASPGRLVFGIPAAAEAHVSGLRGITLAYLLDEYENLTIEQQRYVNTLIREKQLPTTFLVGSRLFGLRTHETLSAGEENRQGSEFDQVVLEEAYRSQSHRYNEFCDHIVRRRLVASGFDVTSRTRLDDYFVTPRDQAPTTEQRAQIFASDPERPKRPWLDRLDRQLTAFGLDPESVYRIRDSVAVPESALHEKFAIFLLYRSWADRDDLLAAAPRIRAAVANLRAGTDSASKLVTTYRHYRQDLYAQLLAELRLPQEYYGFGDFVRMSGFLPRNLLVVLKQVTRWSLFQGEQPFRGGRISLRAQREGVKEASNWFLSDAKGLGRIGEETQLAVRRLASLLREMRFADKPVEVSCAAFSTDRHGLTGAALASLDEAVSHSLILDVPNGRRDRNTHVLSHKYQLNPMLAPLFDLPMALRGTARFTAEELNSIFDPHMTDSFDTIRRRIVSRMQAPFATSTAQEELRLG